MDSDDTQPFLNMFTDSAERVQGVNIDNSSEIVVFNFKRLIVSLISIFPWKFELPTKDFYSATTWTHTYTSKKKKKKVMALGQIAYSFEKCSMFVLMR